MQQERTIRVILSNYGKLGKFPQVEKQNRLGRDVIFTFITYLRTINTAFSIY